MKLTVALLAMTLLLWASSNLLVGQAPDSSSEPVCKSSPRACLDLTLNSYLKALLIHKPEALPVAANLKFTENRVERRLGEGLWQTLTKFDVSGGGTKQEYIDVPQGVAGLHMIAMEGTASALFVLKIKVVDRKITEVETHVIRNQLNGTTIAFGGLHGLNLPLNVAPKQTQIHTRDEPIQIAERYLDALKVGSPNPMGSVIAADAYRMENGRLTAGPGCNASPGCENMRTQQIAPIPGFTYRIEAVDEDLGLVWVREDFSARSAANATDSLNAWEAFKIYDGQIHAVEGLTARF